MKDINIKVLPRKRMRYRTCGDYWEKRKSLEIRVVEQVNEDYEFLVAVHELVEFYITRKRGIKEEDIMKYDLDWEDRTDKVDEPGNQEDCIYKKEHRFAENLERLIAAELGIDWQLYDKELSI
jgi:hypothetical protein